jgi:hypothetical protein
MHDAVFEMHAGMCCQLMSRHNCSESLQCILHAAFGAAFAGLLVSEYILKNRNCMCMGASTV